MIQNILVKAKNLRRHQTDAEKIIWSILRGGQTGCKFKRQQPIDPYIVDFVCFEKRLIVEIDGGQHNVEKDKIRTQYLERQGFRILRFWNHDVMKNKEGVLQTIMIALSTPHPNPLPLRERS